jgi:hypothetical protein
MIPRSDNPSDRVPGSALADFPIWFAALAPPISALSHLQFLYIVEHTACATQNKIGLHLVSILFFVLDIAGGLVARREWLKLGADSPGQLPGPLGTRRLMALFGMIGALIFGLFIVAQWFPNLVLGACERT